MDTKDTKTLLSEKETPSARKYKELFFESDDDDEFPEIDCDLCSRTFSNVKAYEQHLNGKKHHQMITKKKLMKKTKPADEDENIDSEPSEELQCDICEKTFSGYKPYVAHMKGSIHVKNAKKQKLRESLKDQPEVLTKNDELEESEDEGWLEKPFARCSICEKVFYDPASFQKHMVGSVHKKKIVQQKVLDSLKTHLQDDPQIDDEEFFTKCDICNKKFSGPVPFKIHLKSAVHNNQVKREQEIEKLKDFFIEDSTTTNLVCKECKKTFTDPFAFKLHLDNNSHEKQNSKDKVLEFVAAHPEIAAVKAIENISSDEDNEEETSYEKGSYFLVCKLCHVSLSGLENARDHVQSKKHMKAKDEKRKLKLLKNKMAEKKANKNAVNGINGNNSNVFTSSKNSTKMADSNDDFELV